MAWISNRWISSTWITVSGAFTIEMPPPGQLTGATSYGDPASLSLLYHRNPRDYSDELVLGLRLLSGLYLFGSKVPSVAIEADALGRYATLRAIGDLSLRTAPLSFDLIASIGASEQPSLMFELDNSDGMISRMVYREPILFMGAQLWDYLPGAAIMTVYRGHITRVRLRGRQAFIEAGEP